MCEIFCRIVGSRGAWNAGAPAITADGKRKTSRKEKKTSNEMKK